MRCAFVSFEHAWTVLRFIRFPVCGTVRTITTVQSMLQSFTVSRANARLFLQQFERGGVFASWEGVTSFCGALKIPCNDRSYKNVGLIARYVAGNSDRSEQVRIHIRAVAADRYKKNSSDLLAECIAACLWKADPSITRYTVTLYQICKIKFHNNPRIQNVLCDTGDRPIESNLQFDRMVTETRRVKSTNYIRLLTLQRTLSSWTLWDEATVAILMALHPRLGATSVLSIIGIDLLFTILDLILCHHRKRKIALFLKSSAKGRKANPVPRALLSS